MNIRNPMRINTHVLTPVQRIPALTAWIRFVSRKATFALSLLLLVSTFNTAHARTFKIATVSPDGLAWMDQLRGGTKEIEARTDGRVKFKIYPGGVQGNDNTVLRKMLIGQLHGGVVATGSLIRFNRDLQLYNLPLKFRDVDEVDHVRELMDPRLAQTLEDEGIVSFHLIETGFAYLMSRKPVQSVAELRNLKTWVPEQDEMSSRILQTFDVSPIPLYLIDVQTGLQTGSIDAVVAPPIVALALQWHNQLKYMTDVPLMYIYSTLMLDGKTFSRLSDEDQTVVREVMNRVFKKIDAANRADNRAAHTAILNQGIQSLTPPADRVEEWRALAKRTEATLLAEDFVTADGLAALNRLLEQVRAGPESSP
tara:strand:+ start:1957 stop:3057 length:1101 start_codon:yes stop_codon:yes gene_type:complete